MFWYFTWKKIAIKKKITVLRLWGCSEGWLLPGPLELWGTLVLVWPVLLPQQRSRSGWGCNPSLDIGHLHGDRVSAHKGGVRIRPGGLPRFRHSPGWGRSWPCNKENNIMYVVLAMICGFSHSKGYSSSLMISHQIYIVCIYPLPQFFPASTLCIW